MRDDPYNHRPDEDSAKELMRREEEMLNEANIDVGEIPVSEQGIRFKRAQEFEEWLDDLERERAEDLADERALQRSRRERCE